jgi:hypothetical protein
MWMILKSTIMTTRMRSLLKATDPIGPNHVRLSTMRKMATVIKISNMVGDREVITIPMGDQRGVIMKKMTMKICGDCNGLAYTQFSSWP